MNLVLRPLTDINDPVWSVIILLGCGLIFTLYCVVYILRMSFSEMSDVDKQVNEIIKTWDEEEKQEPVIEIKKSDVEGLDDIRIRDPWFDDGDWNDASINYRKWQ